MLEEKKEPQTRISLKVARERVTNWLSTMASIPYFKDKKNEIPRAVYIPFEDIEQLQEDCRKYFKDDKIKGIRVYFGLAKEPDSTERCFEDFCGLIVPVLEIHASKHKDAIHQSFDSPDPEKTNIYDFTAPCPKYCDPNSELYVKL